MLPWVKTDQKRILVFIFLLAGFFFSFLIIASASVQAGGPEDHSSAVMTFLPEHLTATPAFPTPSGSQQTGRLPTRLAATLFLFCGTIGMLGAGVLIAAILGRLKTKRPPR